MVDTTKKDRVAKMEFTAAQEFSVWFHSLMRFYSTLDFDIMREIVDKVWVDSGRAETWLKNIDQYDDGLKELNDQALRKFVREARLEFNRLRNNPPIRTGMYMLVNPEPSKTISQRFFEDGTSIFIIRHKDGRTLVITGPRGSGKTHFAVYYIMPDAIKAGLKVIGNIPFVNDVPGYRYSERMSETMRFICEERLKGNFTCRLYDEVQLSQKVMRVASHSYQTQADIWALERKFGSMTVAILQRESQIPAELRDFTDLRIHKPSARDKTLAEIFYRRSNKGEFYKGITGGRKRNNELIKMGVISEPVEVKNVSVDLLDRLLSDEFPDMDTYGLGLFNVDFDYKDYYDWMTKELGNSVRKWDSGLKISEKQLRLTIEYMSDPKYTKDFVMTDDIRAVAIKELMMINGWKLKEAAEKYDWNYHKAYALFKKLEIPIK